MADTANRAALQAAGYAARTVAVDVLPLSKVTDRYAPGQIGILSIDVEGTQRSVIVSAEWYAFRPRVIVVEAIAPLTNEPTWFAWEGLLLEAGYCFALFDGINRFYYHAEEPELRHALCVPANALDDYCPKRFLEVQEILSERAGAAGGTSPEDVNKQAATQPGQDMTVWFDVTDLCISHASHLTGIQRTVVNCVLAELLQLRNDVKLFRYDMRLCDFEEVDGIGATCRHSPAHIRPGPISRTSAGSSRSTERARPCPSPRALSPARSCRAGRYANTSRPLSGAGVMIRSCTL